MYKDSFAFLRTSLMAIRILRGFISLLDSSWQITSELPLTHFFSFNSIYLKLGDTKTPETENSLIVAQ